MHEFNNESGTPRQDPQVTSHRVRSKIRSKLAGRAPVVAAATIGLLGLGLAGVSAMVTEDSPSTVTTTAATASAEQDRAAEAARADRSERTAAAAPPAQATPQAPATKAAPSKAPSKAATPKAAPAKPKPTATKKKAAPAWVSPMPGAENTSCFGMRWGVLHAGLDLAAPENTPIRAVGAGTITAAGWAFSGYGISVVIDHGNGVFTHYAHQNRTAVSIGDKVKPGQVIGYEGSTGDSTGPHLHFEVHKGMWNQVDPGPWMRDHGVNIGC